MATSGYFTYTVSNGEATITKCDRSISGNGTLPATLGGCPVTSIGGAAFSGCTGLTNITIPYGVTSIEGFAFQDCTNLTSITIPDSVTSIDNGTFKGCTGLTSITIPDSVTSISYRTFYDCSSLTSITIPDSVTSIGDSAFEYCTSLTSITIPNSVTSIGMYAFYGCSSLIDITIPNSVTSIGSYAFENCLKLLIIGIPDSVKEIGSRVFGYCTNLKAICYEGTLQNWSDILIESSNLANDPMKESNIRYYLSTYYNIEENYYIYDKNNCLLKFFGKDIKLTIPNFITSIGDRAFEDCTNLTSITIPDSVKTIGFFAFDGCKSLKKLNITDLEAWCNIGFDNSGSNPLQYGAELYLNGNLLTNIIVPDSVTSINDYAFYHCNSLISITIPDSVTSIGNYAFLYCQGLKNVKIENGVTSIGDYAFEYCKNLTSITIPDSVTSIGNYAFRYCTSLKSIIIPDSVTSIGWHTFEYCQSLKSVTIGNGVTNILHGTFAYCTNLTSITIPDSVISIAGQSSGYDSPSFNGCENLQTVRLSNHMTNIETNTFKGCPNLKKIYMPNSIKKIETNAFTNSDSTQLIIQFLGSEEEKNQIDIQDAVLQQCTWICGYPVGDWIYLRDEERMTGTIIEYTGVEQGQTPTVIKIPDTLDNIYKIIEIKKDILPNSLTTLTLSNNMTTLLDGNFSNLINLTTVNLSPGLIDMGIGAFANTKITSLSLPASIQNLSCNSFQGMNDLRTIEVSPNHLNYWSQDGVLFDDKESNKKLVYYPRGKNTTEYTIPEGVIIIDNYAFQDCQLQSIHIPTTITNINEDAFKNCTILENVYIANLESWLNINFVNDTSNPLYYAENFHVNEELTTSIKIPDEITALKPYVFVGFANLDQVELWEVNLISKGAFALQQGVTGKSWNDINLNPNVQIEENSFTGRGSTIANIYYGNSEDKFNNRIKDEDIKSTTINTHYNGVKTEEWEISNNALMSCSKQIIEDELIIPEEVWGIPVTKIGYKCFKNNQNIKQIKLHNNIISIEGEAFYNCFNLTNIVWGDKLIHIGTSAFAYTDLNNIILPNSLKIIGETAFAHCKSLSSITIGDDIDFIGSQAFYDSKLHGKINSTTNTYEYSDNWKEGLFFLQGDESQYLVDINEKYPILNNEINLENLSLKLIASGCMDINIEYHDFLKDVKVIKLPFHLERLNTNAINLEEGYILDPPNNNTVFAYNVVVNGDLDGERAWVKINGKIYTEPFSIFVKHNDKITIHVDATQKDIRDHCEIYVNNSLVQKGENGYEPTEYELIVTNDTNILFEKKKEAIILYGFNAYWWEAFVTIN